MTIVRDDDSARPIARDRRRPPHFTLPQIAPGGTISRFSVLSARPRSRIDESMSMEAAVTAGALSPFEQLRFARQVILTESRALAAVADRLDGEFCRAVAIDLCTAGAT